MGFLRVAEHTEQDAAVNQPQAGIQISTVVVSGFEKGAEFFYFSCLCRFLENEKEKLLAVCVFFKPQY